MDDSIDRRSFLARAAAVGSAGFAAGVGELARASRMRGVARAACGAGGAGPPIRGRVIRRGASGFAAAAHVYNSRFDGVLPSLVARPLDAADVRTAVSWGVAHGVPLRARSPRSPVRSCTPETSTSSRRS